MATSDRARLDALAGSRIALGTLFLIRTTPLALLLHFPFETDAWPILGWPTTAWSGSSGLHLPHAITAAICVARTLAAALLTVGLFSRVSGLVAGTLGYLTMAQHPFGAAFTLHLLYQGAIVLALGDCGVALSVRSDKLTNPASSVQLVRWFIASIYLWAGMAKLRPDWLDGRTLELFRADGAFAGWAARTLLATHESRAACAVGVAAIELCLPVLLLVRRTQRMGVGVAFALHALIEMAARPDLLGWEMMALLLSLIPQASRTEDADAVSATDSPAHNPSPGRANQ